MATAQLLDSPDEKIPLFRLASAPKTTTGDFVFLRGRRPDATLPSACFQERSQTLPGSDAWLIASPVSVEDPREAVSFTGQIALSTGGSTFRVESLQHTMVRGASGGPVVGDAGVFGIASEAAFGIGFVVPIWNIISIGQELGLELNRLRRCELPLPPRASVFECLGRRDPTCFAGLSLQLAAVTASDEAYRQVSLGSARVRASDVAMHAARSIRSYEDRVVQLAVLWRIFAQNGQSSSAEWFRSEMGDLNKPLRIRSLMTIAKYTFVKRYAISPDAGLLDRIKSSIESQTPQTRLSLLGQLALILAVNGWPDEARIVITTLRQGPRRFVRPGFTSF